MEKKARIYAAEIVLEEACEYRLTLVAGLPTTLSLGELRLFVIAAGVSDQTTYVIPGHPKTVEIVCYKEYFHFQARALDAYGNVAFMPCNISALFVRSGNTYNFTVRGVPQVSDQSGMLTGLYNFTAWFEMPGTFTASLYLNDTIPVAPNKVWHRHWQLFAWNMSNNHCMLFLLLPFC